MTCVWNGLRLPLLFAASIWRGARRPRVHFIDPRLLTPHLRRDLGFDR